MHERDMQLFNKDGRSPHHPLYQRNGHHRGLSLQEGGGHLSTRSTSRRSSCGTPTRSRCRTRTGSAPSARSPACCCATRWCNTACACGLTRSASTAGPIDRSKFEVKKDYDAGGARGAPPRAGGGAFHLQPVGCLSTAVPVDNSRLPRAVPQGCPVTFRSIRISGATSSLSSGQRTQEQAPRRRRGSRGEPTAQARAARKSRVERRRPLVALQGLPCAMSARTRSSRFS